MTVRLRDWRVLAFLAGACILAGFVLLYAQVQQAADHARHATAETSQTKKDNRKLASGVDALRRQVQANGQTPVVPSPSQLVRGQQGEQGRPGRGVASMHIVSCELVALYTDGTSADLGYACGAAGAQGADGQPGHDGSDGAAGKDGAQGPPGRSVTSTTCDQSTGRWVVSYSDGTSADGGPCTTSTPEPSPSPSPSPSGPSPEPTMPLPIVGALLRRLLRA